MSSEKVLEILPPSRRQALLGASLLGAAFALPRAARAQVQLFSSVQADMSGLRARGLGGPYVERAGAVLQRALERSFAGRTGARGAPRLVARVDLIQLSALPEADDFGFGGSSDAIRGEGIVAQGRQVLARVPILASLPSGSSGAHWSQPDNEQQRTAALCMAFAGWLARSL